MLFPFDILLLKRNFSAFHQFVLFESDNIVLEIESHHNDKVPAE